MPRETNSPARAAVVIGFPDSEPEQLRLFPGEFGGVDLAKLRRERAAIAERSRAANTARAYASDWRDFHRWCAAAGRSSLPASSDSCQLYMMELAGLGRLPATLARRAAAIAEKHAAAGLRSPIDDDVRELLGGLRRKIGAAPKNAKAALSVAELRGMLEATPKNGKGARDRALLLVGFASGLRRSELANLRLADVRFERRGAIIALGRSKTDQEGRGRSVGIHRGKRRETCPVLALQAWIRERGNWPGALFCAVREPGGEFRRVAMAAQSVADAVKDAARRAGLDASRFGAHSLRAGLVTAAGGAGVGTLAIMSRTGHKSEKVLRSYMRPSNALAVDPLAGLL